MADNDKPLRVSANPRILTIGHAAEFPIARTLVQDAAELARDKQRRAAAAERYDLANEREEALEDADRCEDCGGPADIGDNERVQCECGSTVCGACCEAFEGESFCSKCVIAKLRARNTEIEAKVATLATMNGNLSDDLEDQHRLAKSWSESSALWLGSWERLIGELGELANVVRARPEGSRCATVEELDALLTMQADDPGSGVMDADATVSPDCIVSPDCGSDS